jgi:hypothetical protein
MPTAPDNHDCAERVREGYIFIGHQPLQLPDRILVPKRVDGLLVPVACSASHVGYQTTVARHRGRFLLGNNSATLYASASPLGIAAQQRGQAVPSSRRD